MQGRGVTNYSTGKPSHDYTSSTTEFDDALVKRGIVTKEQVIMAKGASLAEAIRIVEHDSSRRASASTCDEHKENDEENDSNSDTDSDSFQDDSEDEDFMRRYREERLEQLKQSKRNKHGHVETMTTAVTHSQPTSVTHITRDEWKTEVNDVSIGGRWVIITMTESSGKYKDHVVQELNKIGNEFCSSSSSKTGNRIISCTRRRRRSERNSYNGSHVIDDDHDDCANNDFRLLTINADDAIPNWPEERVPAIFAYLDGTKQHEWIASRKGEFPSKAYVEQLLRNWNVIK